MRRWEARGRTILDDADRVPKVMGIVNVTPDSFSDGGLCARVRPRRRASLCFGRGGGQLARSGRRINASGGRLREPRGRAEQGHAGARASLPHGHGSDLDRHVQEPCRRAGAGAGASIVNDVTALRGDPEMARVIARSGAGVVLMHMRGQPKTMQQNPHYDDVVTEVLNFLAERVAWAMSQGIARSHIAVDPGIGFGKTLEHNLQLLRNLGRFATLGCVVVVGTSRKGFLGALSGRGTSERMVASTVSSLAACAVAQAWCEFMT